MNLKIKGHEIIFDFSMTPYAILSNVFATGCAAFCVWHQIDSFNSFAHLYYRITHPTAYYFGLWTTIIIVSWSCGMWLYWGIRWYIKREHSVKKLGITTFIVLVFIGMGVYVYQRQDAPMTQEERKQHVAETRASEVISKLTKARAYAITVEYLSDQASNDRASAVKTIEKYWGGAPEFVDRFNAILDALPDGEFHEYDNLIIDAKYDFLRERGLILPWDQYEYKSGMPDSD